MHDYIQQLHRDDCRTRCRCSKLLGRPYQPTIAGYERTEGAFVDWDLLIRALSPAEGAALHIARGLAIAERRGGLPEEARQAVPDAVAATV